MSNDRKPIALILDDDTMFCVTAEKVLANLGVGALAMEKVSDFMGALTELKPDLLFIDLHLGEESGLKLIAKIRQEMKITIPIIVVSGEKSPTIVSSALELGANDYILKPFSQSLLANKLAPFVTTSEIENRDTFFRPLSAVEQRARVTFNGKLSGVDELGVYFTNPHLIPKGAMVRIGGPFIRELTGSTEDCLVCVTGATLIPETGHYRIYAEHEFADTHFLQSIRQWIAAQSKNKVA